MTTLVDIKNALFTHFMTQSSFALPDDLRAIKIDPKDGSPVFAEHKDIIVRKALDDFEKATLLAKVSETLWVLTQPLSQLTQQVVVSPLTALMLAEIVNGWMSDEKQETGYVVNQLQITDRDLQNLCHITHQLMAEREMPPDEGEQPDAPPRGGHGRN